VVSREEVDRYGIYFADPDPTRGVACAPVGDGAWLFAGADGSLLRAPSFLGPLARLAETCAYRPPRGASR
jgi:hypothetical protein